MQNEQSRFPITPELAPQRGNRFTRWLGRSLFYLLGWRFEGELPNCPKLVIAAAPHTSNWDFILVMLARLVTGVQFSYLMKKEAFFWPLKGLFIRMGGVPIDRSKPGGLIQQVVDEFERNDRFWVAITPEGTRSKVTKWKTGFLRIAEQADVPVYLVSFDYPTKRFILAREWPLTGDNDADAEAIREYLLSRYKGRHSDKQ